MTERRAEVEWKIIWMTPEAHRDNGGPSHPRLRLEIPPELFGQSFVENRAGHFEERSLNTSNKETYMDEQDKQSWFDQAK